MLVLLLPQNPPLTVNVISSNLRPAFSGRPSLHISILNNPSNIDLQGKRRRIAMILLVVCVEVLLKVSKFDSGRTFISSHDLFDLSICLDIPTEVRHSCVNANVWTIEDPLKFLEVLFATEDVLSVCVWLMIDHRTDHH